MKNYRQSTILDLVSRRTICSQNALRLLLAQLDIEATQATISRDVKELGLVKSAADGAYQVAKVEVPTATENSRARRAVGEYLRRVERVQQLLVLKTDPGQAQPLAFALDQVAWPEIVGTVAGDDTILVVTKSERTARMLVRRVEQWAKK